MSDKLRDGIKNASDNGAENVKAAGDWVADKAATVKDTAQGLVDKVQERARNVTRMAADCTEKTGEMLGEAEEYVEKAVSDGYRGAEHALEHFGKDVTDIVRKYPLTAVAIGLGLGLLLGRAASPRA